MSTWIPGFLKKWTLAALATPMAGWNHASEQRSEEVKVWKIDLSNRTFFQDTAKSETSSTRVQTLLLCTKYIRLQCINRTVALAERSMD